MKECMKDRQDEYEDIYEAYMNSNTISMGSPDQYQYRQNQLIQKLAEFILLPYIRCSQCEEK